MIYSTGKAIFGHFCANTAVSKKIGLPIHGRLSSGPAVCDSGLPAHGLLLLGPAVCDFGSFHSRRWGKWFSRV